MYRKDIHGSVIFKGETITDVYPRVLEYVASKEYCYALVVEVKNPISLSEELVDEELSLTGVNLGRETHEKYKRFVFSDGKSGVEKIRNRIRMFSKGKYRRAIASFKQLNFILRALQVVEKRIWLYNRLFCLTVNPSLKSLSHVHMSNKPVPPRLLLLDFKPKGEYLSLISVWRLEYVDTAAYGNWIALSLLLGEVCRKSGRKPGYLTVVINKAVLKDPAASKYLLETFKSRYLLS